MKWLGIRGVLFVIMSVLTAIPVFWLGSRQASHYAQEVRRSQNESLRMAERAVQRHLRQLLDARMHDLEGVAAAVEVMGGPRAASVDLLLDSHWKRTAYYQGMYVADENANVLARVPHFEPGQLPPSANNYSDRDYYKQMRATRKTAIGSAHVGKALGKPGIQLASPILSPDGTLTGYVEGTASLTPIVELVKIYATELPRARVTLTDGEGTIIADSGTNVATSSDGFSVAAEAPAAAQASVHAYGIEAPVENLPGWRVRATLPRSYVDHLAARESSHVWVASAFMWLFSAALAGLIAHGFGRRFAELAATAQALGDGRFSHRPAPQRPWEPLEFGILISEMDGMASRLERQTQDLELLVDERTSELANVNARLEVLVNALERAEDGIEISDPEGRYLYVNPALEKITGYTSGELIGNYPRILRSGDYDDSFYDNIQETIRSGNVYSGAFTAKRKDGSIFDQEVTVWPVTNNEGVLTHVVGLRRDITERRKTERALRVSERMASVGTLAAGVAHEINNPLTYVLLSLRVLERELTRTRGELPKAFLDKAQAAVEHALEGSERVQAIVKDLRSFSRANEETVEAIELKQVLDSTLRMVASDIRHRARLTLSYHAVPRVQGDPSRLGQVFMNLLVNAIHSLDDGASDLNEIRISTQTDEAGNAVVEISDTGAGIAPEHLDRIFDPFFTTKPVGEGTGLGLSMCHNIIGAMKGHIRVASSPGNGTTFTITLPPATGVTAVTGRPNARLAERVPSSKLLIVDDDRAVALVLAAVLERHSVTVVHDAASALAALQRENFDAIFCDVMMPGTSGLALYEQIRSRGRGEERQVIFITGGTLSASLRDALDQTRALCLEKPLSERELEQAILACREATKNPSRPSVSAARSN